MNTNIFSHSYKNILENRIILLLNVTSESIPHIFFTPTHLITECSCKLFSLIHIQAFRPGLHFFLLFVSPDIRSMFDPCLISSYKFVY